MSFMMSQGSKNKYSKRQEAEGPSLSRPGNESQHNVTSTVFYWAKRSQNKEIEHRHQVLMRDVSENSQPFKTPHG